MITINQAAAKCQLKVQTSGKQKTLQASEEVEALGFGTKHSCILKKRGKLPQNCEDYLKKKKMLKRLKEKCGKSQ